MVKPNLYSPLVHLLFVYGKNCPSPIPLELTKFNKKTHQPEEELNDEKFLEEYCKAVIKGWAGFKYSYLEELLLVDISSLDPEDDLAYTTDNAEMLMKNSSVIDTWVTETVGDLENFTGNKSS